MKQQKSILHASTPLDINGGSIQNDGTDSNMPKYADTKMDSDQNDQMII
jgi:hypothetical protein